MKSKTKSKPHRLVRKTWESIHASIRSYIENGNKTNLAYALHDVEQLRSFHLYPAMLP